MTLDLLSACGLAVAGMAAGGLNALAGGGGFIVLPALMLAGSTAVHANTTGSVAVLPGAFVTVLAYRKGLGADAKSLPLYITLGILGSILGSALLLFTTNEAFLQLLPWLLLGATLLFLFGQRLTEVARRSGKLGSDGHRRRWQVPVLLSVIAIYGGYFGGGMGIMTLAALALLGIEDIHEINALKSILVFIICTVSVLFFIAQGAVDWVPALPMMAGNLVGGYAASRWAVGLPKVLLRRVISGLCVTITLAYMLRAWVLR